MQATMPIEHAISAVKLRQPHSYGLGHEGYYPHAAVAALVSAATSPDRQHVPTDTPTPPRADQAAPAAVSRHSAQTISDQLFEIGDAFTTDLIQAGADPQMAGNVVATMMLRAAWAIAGSGKIIAGKGDPDPALFAEAAMGATKSVTFKCPSDHVAIGAKGGAA